MTGAEWDKIVAVITANWPHSHPPDESLAKWGHDLEDLPAAEVLAAVEALYRDGREHAPNGGQIRAKVAELGLAQVPEPDEAYALAMHAASSVGMQDGLDWLKERQPLVAAAAERFPWRALCMEPIADGTRRAQFRTIYAQVRERAEKAQRYAGLPEVRPRQLQPRSMKELARTALAELGPGGEEAA
jgi:hypothetical protein